MHKSCAYGRLAYGMPNSQVTLPRYHYLDEQTVSGLARRCHAGWMSVFPKHTTDDSGYYYHVIDGTQPYIDPVTCEAPRCFAIEQQSTVTHRGVGAANDLHQRRGATQALICTSTQRSCWQQKPCLALTALEITLHCSQAPEVMLVPAASAAV
jgi:hypothetical protein